MMDLDGIHWRKCKVCDLDTPAEELTKGVCEDCLTALYAPDIEDRDADGFVSFEPKKRKKTFDDC